jgi:hypothetical protein
MLHTKQEDGPMDVDQIWRFELVRGFSNDVHRGACLLTAISWLVDGKRNDRPATACRILAQCGRQVNDILVDDDRQRLKIFICRLAGSKDCEAKKRRTRIFVDVLLGGLLGTDGLSPRERLSIRLGLASARFWIRLGPLAQSAARAIEIFEKHYTRAQDYQRARLVDLICKAFDAALNAGKQGEIDPVQAADAMTAYERMTGIRSASAQFS